MGRTAALNFVPCQAGQLQYCYSGMLNSGLPRLAGVIWKTLIRRGVADSGIRNKNAQLI